MILSRLETLPGIGQLTDERTIRKDRLLLSIPGFFSFFFKSSLYNLNAGIVKVLGGGDSHLGLLASVASLGDFFQILGVPILNFLKSNRRAILLVLSLEFFLAFFPPAAVYSATFLAPIDALKLFIAGSALIVIISAPIANIQQNWIGDLVPRNRLGWFNSYRLIIMTLGSIFGGYAIGFIADAFPSARGYTAIYLYFPLACLAGIICFARVTDRRPQQLTIFPRAGETRDKIPWKSVAYWGYIAFYVLWAFGRTITATFLPKFLMDQFGFTMTKLAWLLIIQSVVSCLAMYGLGRLSDLKGNRFFLIAAGAFISLIMLLPVTTAWWGILPVFIYSFLNGAAGPTHTMLAINFGLEIFPDKGRALYLAVSRFFVSGALLIAPLLAGFLMAAFSDFEWKVGTTAFNRYSLAFIAGAVLTFSSVLPLILMGRRKVE